MPQTQPWTVGRLLAWTTDFLRGRGSESARLDAEVLLSEARGCQRIDLYTAYDEVPPEPVRTAFRELVRRRGEGTPVAYLVGRREFYSLSFRVTPDVLIPRPETEFVVVALLDMVKQDRRRGESTAAIADVGTGSGVIAICAVKYIADCRVTATDISQAALVVARANAAEHGMSERIEFVHGDLLATIPADRRFDYIASNPPYVRSQEIKTLAADVAECEPRAALEAGPRGTEVIERLIPQAAERLRAGGGLILEISSMLEADVVRLLAADGHFEILPTVKDLAGLSRVVSARRLG